VSGSVIGRMWGLRGGWFARDVSKGESRSERYGGILCGWSLLFQCASADEGFTNLRYSLMCS